MEFVVGPTELFAGKKISRNPFLGHPLPVSTPPTTFDNVGAAGGDPANVDPPYRFRPPLPDWIDHLKSFQESTRVRRFLTFLTK